MEIMKTIALPVGELAAWLEETYQVDASETVAKWRELTGINITLTSEEVTTDEIQSITVTASTKNKKIPKTKEVCQHIFLNGLRVGTQCTTKPKGGATYCSAHKPKDSKIKSDKISNKEVKPADNIDPNFESEEETPKKASKTPKKVVKKPKKTSGDTDLEESDIDKKVVKKPKKTSGDTDLEESDFEPTTVTPLLKKMGKSMGKSAKKIYNTDDEKIDQDLELSD